MARTPGATSKNKDRLWKALKAEYGEQFDPVMQMAKNSNRLQDDLDAMYETGRKLVEDKDGTKFMERIRLAEITNNAWDKVSAYVQPKLKQVEVQHSGEVDVKEYRGVSEVYDRVEELIGPRADRKPEGSITH